MTQDVVWTAPLMARFRELHDTHMSFAKIARQLNKEFNLQMTTNACVGKARRADFPMRLKFRYQRSEKRTEEPPRGTRPKAAFGRDYVKPVTLKPVALAPTAPGPVNLGPPTRAVIQLHELTRFTCTWPYGLAAPYSYCGETTHLGSSFCRHHYDRVYVKPAKAWR